MEDCTVLIVRAMEPSGNLKIWSLVGYFVGTVHRSENSSHYWYANLERQTLPRTQVRYL